MGTPQLYNHCCRIEDTIYKIGTRVRCTKNLIFIFTFWETCPPPRYTSPARRNKWVGVRFFFFIGNAKLKSDVVVIHASDPGSSRIYFSDEFSRYSRLCHLRHSIRASSGRDRGQLTAVQCAQGSRHGRAR